MNTFSPKFLLISVHAETDIKKSVNIGPNRLVQYLKLHGYKCDLCEIGIDQKNKYLTRAKNGEYSVIGLSSTYFFIKEELNEFNDFYKLRENSKCNALFVVGGQCPSQDPKFWLDLGFDAVIRGYGEEPLLALANKIKKTQSNNINIFAGIKGFSFYKNKTLINNKMHVLNKAKFRKYNYFLELEMVNNRHAYPIIFPEFKSIFFPEFMTKYNLKNEDFSKSINLYTSHQCPNRCGYCCSSNFLNKMYKCNHAFSIKAKDIFNIVNQYIIKRHANFFSFWDDDFCGSRSRLVDFCSLIIKAKDSKQIPQYIKFLCQTRVMAFRHNKKIDDELIALMKQAGFSVISLGVENFSKRLLQTKIMRKYGYDYEIAMEVIDKISKAGICPSINFMMCVPEATPDEIKLNVSALLELQKKMVSVNIGFYIDSYPGATVYKSNDYQTLKETIFNPIKNNYFIKERYFLPQNHYVKSALDFYMNIGVKNEINNIIKKMGENFPLKSDVYLMNLLKSKAMILTLPNSQSLIKKIDFEINKRCEHDKKILEFNT